MIVDNKGLPVEAVFEDKNTALTFKTDKLGKYSTLVRKGEPMLIKPIGRLGFEDLNVADLEMFSDKSEMIVADVNRDGKIDSRDYDNILQRLLNNQKPEWVVVDDKGNENLSGGFSVMYQVGDIDKSSNLSKKDYLNSTAAIDVSKSGDKTVISFSFEKGTSMQLDYKFTSKIQGVFGSGEYSVKDNKLMFVKNNIKNLNNALRIVIDGTHTTAEVIDMLKSSNSYLFERSGNRMLRYVLDYQGVSSTNDFRVGTKVYPNPLSKGSDLTIESLFDTYAKLYDTSGRLIKEFEIEIGVNRYELKGVNKGVYILIITHAETLQKLVKRVVVLE